MADAGSLPSKNRMAALPRWAIVAFAARCARRALLRLEGVNQDVRAAAVEAVCYAELAAAQGTSDGDDIEKYSPYRTLYTSPPAQVLVVESAVRALSRRDGCAVILSASQAAWSAYFAVVARGREEWQGYGHNAAMFAMDNARKADESSAEHALRAVNAAHQAGVAVPDILTDMELLLKIADREKWNKLSPVSVAVFEHPVD